MLLTLINILTKKYSNAKSFRPQFPKAFASSPQPDPVCRLLYNMISISVGTIRGRGEGGDTDTIAVEEEKIDGDKKGARQS